MILYKLHSSRRKKIPTIIFQCDFGNWYTMKMKQLKENKLSCEKTLGKHTYMNCTHHISFCDTELFFQLFVERLHLFIGQFLMQLQRSLQGLHLINKLWTTFIREERISSLDKDWFKVLLYCKTMVWRLASFHTDLSETKIISNKLKQKKSYPGMNSLLR